ncbi:MAG: SigE family RNA polymerase sigma factor [Streptosporangiaceae bacterium]|nr:SigE family RNA polymerase sigma factor [Streptosporangiaceae bacterium]
MRPDPDTGRSVTGHGAAAVEQLLAARGRHLMQAAIALAGSRPDGEDLLQAALERLLLNYRRVGSDAEGYLRRTLYNLAADGWRRRRVARRWRPVVAAPGRLADGTDVVDIRDALVRLLAQLPPRQRAVVVLRYWEQLTEAETAAILGCSPGSVKSAASRGMSRLRELAGDRPLKLPIPPTSVLSVGSLSEAQHEYRP